MIFLLICCLLFAQAWADTSPPTILESYQGCAPAISLVVDGSKTATTTVWGPVNTGEIVPPPACTPSEDANSWTVIITTIGESGGLQDQADDITYIPCSGTNAADRLNPLLVLVATHECVLAGSYISPTQETYDNDIQKGKSPWPHAKPSDYMHKTYTGPLWGITHKDLVTNDGVPLIMEVWTVKWEDYHDLKMILAYGDGTYQGGYNGASCRHWSEPKPGNNWKFINAFCQSPFPRNGTFAAMKTDTTILQKLGH